MTSHKGFILLHSEFSMHVKIPGSESALERSDQINLFSSNMSFLPYMAKHFFSKVPVPHISQSMNWPSKLVSKINIFAGKLSSYCYRSHLLEVQRLF